jgi:hypothetical protein
VPRIQVKGLKQKGKEKGQKKEKKKLERHACNLHEHQGFKRVYLKKSLGPTQGNQPITSKTIHTNINTIIQ